MKKILAILIAGSLATVTHANTDASTNVGKINVSAAVGGYQSTTAMAVGTGYRFNQNFATKAGVAVSGGKVSYNAGVNFEW